jgi:hypothetical protein
MLQCVDLCLGNVLTVLRPQSLLAVSWCVSTFVLAVSWQCLDSVMAGRGVHQEEEHDIHMCIPGAVPPHTVLWGKVGRLAYIGYLRRSLTRNLAWKYKTSPPSFPQTPEAVTVTFSESLPGP